MPTNNAIDNSTKVTVYNANDTWTKDSRTKFIEVYLVGSGGAGGSGRRGASTLAGGGGGGCGASFRYTNGPASVFPDTASITVAGVTTGALSQTVDSTNGIAGATGSNSYFGLLQTDSTSMGQGLGGSSGSVNGGTLWGYTYERFNRIAASNVAATGGQGRVTTGTGVVTGTMTTLSASGGGGAGADSVTPRQGGTGGIIQVAFGVTTAINGGLGGSEGGQLNGFDGTAVSTSNNAYLVSTGSGGGGGGGQSSGAAAGRGGHGGFPGGGGGGGGGSLNGTNSGAGGNGAAGQVTVIEHF